MYLLKASDPQLRDPTTAVIHVRKAMELQPNEANHRRILGVALLRAGDYQVAALTLEQVEETTKDIHRYRFFLAMAYWHLGDREKSLHAYEQAALWMDKNQPNDANQRRFRNEAALLLGIHVLADTK